MGVSAVKRVILRWPFGARRQHGMVMLSTVWTLFLISAGPLAPQQTSNPEVPAVTPPPALEYHGKPMSLPFRCTDEDIQAAALTCSEDEPCPVYLELTSVEEAGNHIRLTGDLHSSTVTLFSVLLGSDDGGATWRELYERMRGGSLDHVEAVDADTAWVSGELVAPLPQDPFLLLTADGGKTWRRRAIFGEGAENHLGTVQQFYFSSKTDGSLVIDRGIGSDSDRYELYESRDGGESWNIRQSSQKPIPLKRPAPAAEWRLRADGPSQSFHVEHRSGERWTTSAAFSVKIGSCKPEPPAGSDAAPRP